MRQFTIASKFIKLGLAVTALSSVAGIFYMVTLAINAVRNGIGLQTFKTVWLVESNWIQFLIFIVVAVVSVVGGLIYRWREIQIEKAEIETLNSKIKASEGAA